MRTADRGAGQSASPPLTDWLVAVPKTAPLCTLSDSCSAASEVPFTDLIGNSGEQFERLRSLEVNCEFVSYDGGVSAHREAKAAQDRQARHES
jgi:hypothetical protein